MTLTGYTAFAHSVIKYIEDHNSSSLLKLQKNEADKELMGKTV